MTTTNDTMQFRWHRGSLADSMATVVVIEPTKAALLVELRKVILQAHEDSVEVEPYGPGIDERIGWRTHIVTINGSAVGMTDGPLRDTRKN